MFMISEANTQFAVLYVAPVIPLIFVMCLRVYLSCDRFVCCLSDAFVIEYDLRYSNMCYTSH